MKPYRCITSYHISHCSLDLILNIFSSQVTLERTARLMLTSALLIPVTTTVSVLIGSTAISVPASTAGSEPTARATWTTAPPTPAIMAGCARTGSTPTPVTVPTVSQEAGVRSTTTSVSTITVSTAAVSMASMISRVIATLAMPGDFATRKLTSAMSILVITEALARGDCAEVTR